MSAESAPLESWVAQFLRRVGIDTPQPDVRLHRRLVAGLRDVGPGRTLGQQLAAVRYVVRDEHGIAGRALAQARADHEEKVLTRRIELLRGEEKITVALAKDIAESEAAEERRAWLVAEQEERTLREFLKAIADDLENHRTDRADQRAGDRTEAQGYGGGL